MEVRNFLNSGHHQFVIMLQMATAIKSGAWTLYQILTVSHTYVLHCDSKLESRYESAIYVMGSLGNKSEEQHDHACNYNCPIHTIL
jgi:hypothetical protein